MRLLSIAFALSLALFDQTGRGQTYTISTFAGGGLPINVPGISAAIGGVSAVAVDAAGNVFIGSTNGSAVLRLDAATGVLTPVAGNGVRGFSGDGGPATSAQLSYPYGIALDAAGNLYIADYENGRVRKVSKGIITTVAGGGTTLGDNGPPTSAKLIQPWGLALDSAGNLYIADQGDNRVRKVSDDVITTVAGDGTIAGDGGDGGPATSAQVVPEGIAVDSAGNLYIADYNGRVRKVSNGVITTVAGNGYPGFSGDGGPATNAELNGPAAVAVDSAGNLYIMDENNWRVRKVSNGVITTVAGNGSLSFDGEDGPSTEVALAATGAIALGPTGSLYIGEQGRVRKLSNGVITTVAGNGTTWSGGDGGPAASAQIRMPCAVAVDSAGDVYIADVGDSRIRKVSKGIITTVAGGGDQFPLPVYAGLAADSAGNLYIASDQRVRRISKGVISTVAGNPPLDPTSPPAGSISGDNGPAVNARLFRPNGVAVDRSGNVYIVDTADNRIRKVSNGVITTVAGKGTPGFSGDGGPANMAQLAYPVGLALDSAGNLYISDTGNNRIRKVSHGVITTVAGNGMPGSSGDNGPATKAQLLSPAGVAVDSAGNLYVASGDRIRKVTHGLITTIAGGAALFGDRGARILASEPVDVSYNGVAVDGAGKVYVVDWYNQRVRLLTPPPHP